MKASVEEYNAENGYGSENVDVWTVLQGHSQNRFAPGYLRTGAFGGPQQVPITIHPISIVWPGVVELSETTGASRACKP